MTRFVLFGATTPSGNAFLDLAAAAGHPVSVAGRTRPQGAGEQDFLACDLTGPPPAALFTGEPAVLVSFAPIWHLAPFLAGIGGRRPPQDGGLRGVIACSSSSVLTKRFAANRFDRDLVARLRRAETLLQESCARLDIPCRILAPTLIYGRSGPYADRNLSQLLRLLRRLPVLPIPAETGLRQPIHCRQLASVCLRLGHDLAHGPSDPFLPTHLPLGGDETLSYADMLRRLQRSAGKGDAASRCLLLPLPTRLFHLLAAPLLPCSAKTFEAVLRIGADLAGFTPAHELLGGPPEPFPVTPLAR